MKVPLIGTALRRMLRVFALPVRRAAGHGNLLIQPWRGYGSRDEICLVGRVLRQPGRSEAQATGALRRDLGDLLRRVLRRGVGNAEVEARFAGAVERVVTDREGFFEIRLTEFGEPPETGPWHPVRLSLRSPGPAEAETDVFIPPPGASCLVISDIDDTVMFTGVGNKIKMFWRLFVSGARARVAFPGVAAFYRALHEGAAGGESNPLIYISRGPWSIYDVLDAFFNLNRIPVGPILFLRDWGLTLRRPLPRRAKDHKSKLIRTAFSVYRDWPVVLIGDSGQRDPELYAEIVREFPGRVRAVYIRNVSGTTRGEAIGALAQELAADHAPLVLADDSFTMARHAAGLGLISQKGLETVLAEKCEDEAEAQGETADAASAG